MLKDLGDSKSLQNETYQGIKLASYLKKNLTMDIIREILKN